MTGANQCARIQKCKSFFISLENISLGKNVVIPFITDYWKTFASQLKTIKVDILPIENFQQRRHFARMLHLSERYQEASELREELMRTMDKHLLKMKNNHIDKPEEIERSFLNMYDYGKLVYLDLQKTGSRFVVDFLEATCKLSLRSGDEHTFVREDYDPDTYYFITVRHPETQYSSL